MITTAGITIDGKVYRNLESQVAYNAQQIELLKDAAGAEGAILNKITVNRADWIYSTTSFKFEASKPLEAPEKFIPILIQTNTPYFMQSPPSTLPYLYISVEDGVAYLKLARYAPAPEDTYQFTLIALPSTEDTPSSVIDLTPYPPKGGLEYYGTLEYPKENWFQSSGNIYFNYTKDWDLYDRTNGQGKIVHLIPATNTTAQWVAQYRLYTDMLLYDEEIYVYSVLGNPNVDLEFNVYLESTTASTTYYIIG